MLTLVVLASLILAFANGANDNFKGVATLFGGGTMGYRRALAHATVATLAGSLAAALMSGALTRTFSGKGLVPDALAGDPRFQVAVAVGAALTILAATRLGMPVSTTHALAGGLVGAALGAAGAAVHWAAAARALVLPLLLSPIVASLVTFGLYALFREGRRRLAVEKETCLCVGSVFELVDVGPDGTAVLRSTGLALGLGELSSCRTRYSGTVLGCSAQQVLDRLHVVSAWAVSGARGLNDAPKIAALLLVSAPWLNSAWSYALVAVLISIGGLVGARRVAATMSHRIAPMNDGQAFSANLATALLVSAASALGMPVSTTHVSVGAIFGVGLVNRRARWGTMARIALSWITTLPLAAASAAALYAILIRVV